MEYRLAVNLDQVLLALRLFENRLRRLHSEERAILGFDGAYLSIEARDTMAIASATGSWPGNASVSASLLVALAANPPAADPLILTCDCKRVSFGPVKLNCRWQPVSNEILDLPPAADWIRGLILRYTSPQSELAPRGRRNEIAGAERKLLAVVTKAAKPLAPLGITVSELHAFVESRLEKRYAGASSK